MKKTDMVSITVTVVFACLFLCTPALADYNFDGYRVVTIASGTVYGDVFVGYEPWASTRTLTGNFDVPDGDIKWARLYTGIWGGNPDKTGWVNVTFNGVYDRNGLGPIHLKGEEDTNPNVWGSGCGKWWMWSEVTNLTNAGQINTAKTSRINGSIDGRVYGIVLVVVYEGGDNPKDVQYWINDGSDAIHYLSYVCPECGERNESTTYFNGTVNTDIVIKANLTMVHLTGYEPPCSNCLKFNAHELNTSMVDSNDFELKSWDVTDYVASSGNTAWYSRGDDNFVNIANAILVLEREAVEKPDLVITDKRVCWPDNCTICYNVTNAGNGTAPAGHNTTLYVDGVEVAHDHVPVDLAPNESSTGCFNYAWNYTPPSDNITVCADSNNDVDEGSGEGNNPSKNTWICGDVNNDGNINLFDYRKIYLRAGNPDYTLHGWAADVDKSGTINLFDYRKIYLKAGHEEFVLNCWCET